jgi:membrane protease subunit HflC
MNVKASLALLGVVAVVGIGIASTSLFTVNQRYQALVLQFGNPIRVERDPGLKVKLPWQNVETYERRILDLDPPGQEVLLADQKRITVDSFARFRIVDPLEYRKKALTEANFRQVFGGRLNSAVRSEVAKVSLADLLTEKRAQVMDVIASHMRAQAKEFGVEVVDVRIGRADLPEAISQATYNRMRSERVSKAALDRAEGAELKAKIQADADRERTVLLAEAQREAQILRGEGDATRTTILNEAYGRDPEFFNLYRSLDAYGVAFGEGTTMILKPDSEFFRYFGTGIRK